MYREDVQNYPKTYAKSNIDKIINSIDTTMSVTLFGPSGFGKSSMAKYIAFNYGYRSRYSKLRKVNFVYVNLSELSAEIFEESQNLYNQVEHNKQKRFIEILLRSFLESDRTTTYEEARKIMSEFDQSDFKNYFYTYIEKFLRKNKGKLTVLLLDSIETLTKEGFESQKEFLKNFRDQYRTRIEYLFLLDNLKHLDNLNKKNWGNLVDLITQKIVLLTMPKTDECITPKLIDESFTIFTLFTKRTKKFQDRFNLITQWSGGYPPYFKYLFRISNYDALKNLIVDRELELSSERLFTNLGDDHKKVLMDLLKNNKFEPNARGARELLEMGIIRKENDKLRIFSPIFNHYLQNLPE